MCTHVSRNERLPLVLLFMIPFLVVSVSFPFTLAVSVPVRSVSGMAPFISVFIPLV